MVSCLQVCEFGGRVTLGFAIFSLGCKSSWHLSCFFPILGHSAPVLSAQHRPLSVSLPKAGPGPLASDPSVFHSLSRLRYLVGGKRGALLSLMFLHKLFSQFSTNHPKLATTLMQNKTITSQRLLLFLPLPSSEAMKHRASVRSDSFIHSTNVYSQCVLCHELFWGLGVPS